MAATDAAPGAAGRREQQYVEDLCIAAIRALSGDSSLAFRGHRLFRGRQPLPMYAPHLYPVPGRDRFSCFRGAADGMALRLLHTDAGLHQELRPSGQTARLLFDLLEQFRAESLAAPLPGVVHNLRSRHEGWSLAFHRSGLTETALGLLLYTVAQVGRSRITGEPVIAETEDLIEQVRASMAPTLGHDLAGLRRHRADQRAFAHHALSLAAVVAAAAGAADDDADRPAPDDDDESSVRAPFSLLIDYDHDSGAEPGAAAAETGPASSAPAEPYRVFTTRYDRERRAATLARPAVLADLRDRLDRDIADRHINIAQLSRRLEALLCEPSAAGWDAGQEEGLIDGSRLSQLVCSPTERRLFRTERSEPAAAAVVSVLIDCSGSMKQHAPKVAVLVDVLARALDQAGIGNEVLGFTTGAWNGGRALRDYKRAGAPSQPGRLNELSHLVFKDADTPWRRARPAMAALLKADLYREGIDGEAVRWAASRLAARPEARRILMVISDGSPADGATGLANGEQYLEQHLRSVAGRLEDSGGSTVPGGVELHGLGLGLDLSSYYSSSKILDVDQLGTAAGIGDVVDLLSRRAR